MSKWGKDGMVGISKALWEHGQTLRQAELILVKEHGIRHKAGEHAICPLCREVNEKGKGE